MDRVPWRPGVLATDGRRVLGGGWRVVGFLRQRDDSVGAHGPTEVDALLAALAGSPSTDAPP